VNARTILAYLFGRREAILEVAANKAALWTGIVLVLLTSIARNYDQTHITEKPFLWLFGPLFFSLVSGTWLFWGGVGCVAVKEMDLTESERKTWMRWWPQFMGLFWMTAPIAWLYAIPVERFLDSLNAARANVALLSIVSLWRVALMARVFQVLFRVPYFTGLVWVLVPVCAEVIGITLFGGVFARALAAGMGGMRNSPEEEILMNVMGVAFWGSIGLIFLAALMAAALRPREHIQSFPPMHRGRMPWSVLGFAAMVWCGVAIGPQIEVSRNAHVERLMRDGQHREAIDFMNKMGQGNFAPSRPLPPKPFEGEVFVQLPRFFAALQRDDAEWVRAHFMKRLNEMRQHFRYGWNRDDKFQDDPQEQRKEARQRISMTSRFHGNDGQAEGWLRLLEGLDRLPGGREWIVRERVLLEALSDRGSIMSTNAYTSPEQMQGWIGVQERLEHHGITNQARRIELGHEPVPAEADEEGPP
jgi:hypothetical protein